MCLLPSAGGTERQIVRKKEREKDRERERVRERKREAMNMGGNERVRVRGRECRLKKERLYYTLT